MPNSDEKEQALTRKMNNAMRDTNTASSVLGMPEAANFGVIFFMHFSNYLDFLFGTVMRFIVFPSAAIYGLSKAGLEWYKLYLIMKNPASRKDREARNIQILKALWETLNSFGTTGAVITGIVGFCIGASVGMGISITFNFFLMASTVICAAWSVYFAVTAYQTYNKWKALPEIERTHDHPLYKEYRGRREGAIIHGVFAGIVALLTIGVAVAMVAGIFTIGAVIGLIGCVSAVAYTAHLLYKHVKQANADKKTEQEQKKLQTKNAEMQAKLGTSKPNDAQKKVNAKEAANDNIESAPHDDAPHNLVSLDEKRGVELEESGMRQRRMSNA